MVIRKCEYCGANLDAGEKCDCLMPVKREIPCQAKTEPDKVNPQKVIENCIDIITRLKEKCKGVETDA